MEKKRIIISIIIAAMVLILFAIATFAWFFINKQVDSNIVQISAEAGNSIDISIDDVTIIDGQEVVMPDNEKRYGARATLNVDGKGQTSMATGNGVDVYKVAALDEITGEPTALARANATKVIDGKIEQAGDYIEFKLTFRVSIRMRVFLSEESYVTPVSKTGDNIYGNYSKDFIAGASRVSFSTLNPLNGQETLSFVWAPNANYELSLDGVNYDFNEFGNPEDQYYYYDGDAYKYAITPQQLALKEFVTGDIKTTTTMAYNTKEVALLDPPAGEFAYQTVIVRIWVEGGDREAKVALGGGKFDVYLKFFGLNKNDALTAKTERLRQISTPGTIESPSPVINGLETDLTDMGLMYSLNGGPWTAYDGRWEGGVYRDAFTDHAFTGHEYLCLKFPETSTEFETEINILRFYKQPGGLAPPAAADDELNRITGLSGIADSELEISDNAGRSWQDYSSQSEFHGAASVLLRYKETAVKYASDYIELVFTKNIQTVPAGLYVATANNETYISGVIYWAMELAFCALESDNPADSDYHFYVNKTGMSDALKAYSNAHPGAFWVFVRYAETDYLAASAPQKIYFDAYA